jgi:hypothetical protein
MDKSLKISLTATGLLILAFVILLFFYPGNDLVSASKADARKKAEIFNETARYSENAAPTPSIEPFQTTTSPDSAPETPQPAPAISKNPVEDPVSEILSRPDEHFANTVNQLLVAMPTLNPEQQAEAAQHIANLSDDALAAQWSQKMIAQSLPQPASEALFNDMLNRPHEMLLPFLSKLADMPQHPQSTQSVEILDVLFGQPPAGTKWEKWVKIKAQEAQ